jgi:hypothetical protein
MQCKEEEHMIDRTGNNKDKKSKKPPERKKERKSMKRGVRER